MRWHQCGSVLQLLLHFTATPTNAFQAPHHQRQRRKHTSLFHRPLSAMIAEATDTTDEFIANVKVTDVHDDLDILNMPVFGEADATPDDWLTSAPDAYPMANLMQGSAGYIAEHTGKIAVFHLQDDASDTVLRDITLCHILGIRIVLVISTSEHSNLQTAELQLGVLRTEVERKLNRYLCAHQHSRKANVVSGNSFVVGEKHSPDSYHGQAVSVCDSKIQQIIATDILILSNIILDQFADHYIYTDGCQLASQVAVELAASKLILFRHQHPKLLTLQDTIHVQDLPLQMAIRLLQEYHYDKQQPKQSFWHELHWAADAVHRGVCRAHLVNAQLDGALLEELFTAQNGANTCVYHDDELLSGGQSL